MGLPHSDAVPPDIEGMIDSTEDAKSDDKKNDEDEEEEGNFIEMYVDSQFKEHVIPLKEQLEEKTVQLNDVTKHAEKLQTEVDDVDRRYDDACRAILKNSGIQVTDLNSHNIFMEYGRLLEKQ